MVFAYMATPVVIMIAGLLLKVFPPKDFNAFFGFRTATATKSRETWDYCNGLCGYTLMAIGAVFSIVVYALSIFITDVTLLETVYQAVTVLQVFLLLFIAPFINKACKNKFPELYK